MMSLLTAMTVIAVLLVSAWPRWQRSTARRGRDVIVVHRGQSTEASARPAAAGPAVITLQAASVEQVTLTTSTVIGSAPPTAI